MRIWRHTARALVHVNTQTSAEKMSIQSLFVLRTIVRWRAIVPDGHIEITIGAELQVSGIVRVVLIHLSDQSQFRVR